MTKAQLEALIQREAQKHWIKVGTGKDCASADFTAGASLLLPALIEALEALEKIKNHEFKDAIMSDIAERTSRRIEKMLGEK